MKILLLSFLLIIVGFAEVCGQSSDWKAPAEANELKSSLSNKEEALKAGKKLYSTLCVVCHGDRGKGDGIAGAALKPKPTNLTSENFQSQSDGAIYWKITEGRTPMASYEATLSEEQRWQLVNYIRSLKR